MNTLPYANEIKEREREREREFFIVELTVIIECMYGDVSPSMISDKLILPSQHQCVEMSCQCVNIVQGDGNTVFSHLATLVHSMHARERFIPSGRTPGGDRTFMLSLFRKDSRD